MRDYIEDVSSGRMTARVNHSLAARVLIAKKQRGEVVHSWTAWTPIETKLNEEHRRVRNSGSTRAIQV